MSARPAAARLRVAMFGLFGIGNLGNDATLEAMLIEVRRRVPGARILCICNALPPFAADAGVEWVPIDPAPPRGLWRIPSTTLRRAGAALARVATLPLRQTRIRRRLAGVDTLLVVGTGVLDDFGALPWELPSWLLSWCRGAQRVGASVHLVAVGAGPIRHFLNRLLMTRAVRTASTRSYRDHVSREFLAARGIDTSRDPVVPDLVFGLAAPDDPGCARPAATARTVGLGVMGYYGWDANRASGARVYERYIAQIAQFATWLLERGLQVRLLIGELGTDQVAVDDLLGRLERSLAPDLRGNVCAAPIRGLVDLLGEICRTDVVVASRYHNVVGALALGRPVIALGYASKFDALMTDAGLADYCQHVEHLDVKRLIEQFAALTADAGPIAERLRARSSQCRAALTSHFDELFARLTEERVRAGTA